MGKETNKIERTEVAPEILDSMVEDEACRDSIFSKNIRPHMEILVVTTRC